ncbi:hypothetical protein [Haladaptatus sp. DFWS20]|uniref:hypothetical protein n=1 Tax=Haladaptatus sp. DFWS20 TaxID=3403467 RepID=UPI003EBBDE8B
MCRQTSLFITQNDLEDRFYAPVVTDGGYRPRFNITPADSLEVVSNEKPGAINQLT